MAYMVYTLENLLRVNLGRQGENLARAVAFDISTWQASWPDAVFSLIAIRPGETLPYVAVTHVDGHTLVWPLTSADTAIAGRGQLELRAMCGERLLKSATASTVIAESLTGESSDPPEPSVDWVNTVLQAATDAKDSADKAAATLADVKVTAEDARQNIEDAGNAQVERVTAMLPVPGDGDNGKVVTAQDGKLILAATQGVINDVVVDTAHAWSGLHTVDTLCRPFEVVGPVVICEPLGGYPLSVSVAIEPTQEGSGDPSPDNVRPIVGYDQISVYHGGKNLCPTPSLESPYYNYLLPRETFPELYAALRNLKPGEQYRVGWTVTYSDTGEQATGDVKELRIFYVNGEYVAFRYNNQSNEVLDVDIDSIRIYSGNFEVTGSRVISDMRLEWTSGTVGTYTAYTGQTLTLDLGRTVYGGTLNVITGELTVTHENIASYNGEDVGSDWISSTGSLTTGAQVVYRLPDPITYQLQSAECLALVGDNVLFCDTGDVTVGGRESPDKTLNDILTRLSALERNALGG